MLPAQHKTGSSGTKLEEMVGVELGDLGSVELLQKCLPVAPSHGVGTNVRHDRRRRANDNVHGRRRQCLHGSQSPLNECKARVAQALGVPGDKEADLYLVGQPQNDAPRKVPNHEPVLVLARAIISIHLQHTMRCGVG